MGVEMWLAKSENHLVECQGVALAVPLTQGSLGKPVPGGEGCGGLLSSLVDPVLDLAAGLPAAAGHNPAILHVAISEAKAFLSIKRCRKPLRGNPFKQAVKKWLYEPNRAKTGVN
jgi:hypothetical protein